MLLGGAHGSADKLCSSACRPCQITYVEAWKDVLQFD